MGFDAGQMLLSENACTSAAPSLEKYATLGRGPVLRMTTVGKDKYVTRSAETRPTSLLINIQTTLTMTTLCTAALESATVATTFVKMVRLVAWRMLTALLATLVFLREMRSPIADGAGLCTQVTPGASMLSFPKENSLGSFWLEEEVERATPTVVPVGFSIIRFWVQ